MLPFRPAIRILSTKSRNHTCWIKVANPTAWKSATSFGPAVGLERYQRFQLLAMSEPFLLSCPNAGVSTIRERTLAIIAHAQDGKFLGVATRRLEFDPLPRRESDESGAHRREDRDAAEPDIRLMRI